MQREELRELSNRLGQENGDLAKELERLQADRSTDVEELVYLRWVNACLRYELRSFQPLHGKTVERDLSRSLSPESEGKAKQLIFECANSEGKVEKGIDIMDFESDQWSSSNTSCIADSPDRDDPSVSSKNSNWKKVKIFNKLRRLIRGKDLPHRNRGPSTGKNVGTEDSDSSRGSSSISTTTDAASDRQSSSVQNPSLQFCWHSSGKSAGIRRLKSANIDEIKDIEIGRSNHSESSSEHRKCLSGRTASSDFSLKNQLDKHPHPIEKSELLDMAEALNNSKIGTFHRKAASLGSY